MSKKSDGSLNDEIKLRVSTAEKELIKAQAADAGISMSDIIRQVVFNSEKLILLNDGKEIAKEMFQIRSDLDRFIINGSLPDIAVEPLLNALERLSDSLYAVADKITDIRSQEGGDEDVFV